MYAALMCSRRGNKRPGGGRSRRIQLTHTYEDIISVENLLAAWKEFVKGKRKKQDVQEFRHHLMDNILTLHCDLKEGTYKHGGYKAFKISDPKPRDIHKATVRDRLLHHALYRILYPFFDRTWIADSYSCRKGKGTHRAMNRFRQFACKVSKNHTRTCWVLKCDIRKFFASIDHRITNDLVGRYIPDERICSLIAEVIGSFRANTARPCLAVGLPLGNLTSQLLVNVYMNEFDQYVKHTLKAKHYIRYADDFVLLSHDKGDLELRLHHIQKFLGARLSLALHPNKVNITTSASGIDFLGWVHFPDHRVLRTSTKQRMVRRVVGIEKESPTVQSYLGMLGHGNARKLSEAILR